MALLISSFRSFLKLEAASGLILIFAAIAALIIANSPLVSLYQYLLDTPFWIKLGYHLEIQKPLLLWVNDGLMAFFFFLIGLELKREILEGELSSPAQILLPGIAAVGGMAAPAAVYSFLNWGDPIAMRGWAIPCATDIAFALGILLLLGDRVPAALKVFLVSLAIFDDLGAIMIIALFYTGDLSVTALGVGLVLVALLAVLNRSGVVSIAPYILLTIVLWVAVLKSGVHATLAGTLAAFFIPLRTKDPEVPSPLRTLEHDLHPSVAFVILPIFAFCNAGVPLEGLTFASLLEPIPLGISGGLIIGKLVGILCFSWVAVAAGVCRLPSGVNWAAMVGVALLCGVGFTMSLFIGSLAFEQGGGTSYQINDRIGILSGSFIAATAGYFWLRAFLPNKTANS